MKLKAAERQPRIDGREEREKQRGDIQKSATIGKRKNTETVIRMAFRSPSG
jgi:hypothetical protein